MKYRKVKPPEYLKDIIRYFWVLETNGEASGPRTFRIVADGCPGLIYQYGSHRFTYHGQEPSTLPSLFLYGQATRHGNLYSTGAIRATGVTFHPHVLKPMFGFDADECTNEVTDLNLIAPAVSDTLAGADTPKQHVEALSSSITQLIRQRYSENTAIRYSVSTIVTSQGAVPLHKLHASLQLSERQFERRFKQHVGISPKLFSRIARFQSALQHIRSKSFQTLTDVTFGRDYADQPHFIREFREFSGFTPGQYHSPDRVVIEICQP